MKLSPETLDILKNFASINPNLVIKAGSALATISDAKNIMASATIAEKFDQSFGIYDLNEFLSILGLLDDPAIDLKSDAAVISCADKSVKYRFANPSVLTTPQKDIKMPTPDLDLTLSASTIADIRKAASVLGHSIVAIQGTANGKVSIGVFDPKDTAANSYTIDLEVKHDLKKEFSFQFLIANLKLLSGDYRVQISSKLISKWIHTQQKVNYFIALEKTSTI